MSFRSRRNSLVEQVRGLIHRPSPHTTVQNIIELGDLEATDILGFSLHKEAITGSRRSLKKVLLSAICVDYPNDRGQTPLLCACSRDRETNALLLLEYGANPNEKSQEGVTPVHAACYVGNVHLLGKLIEAGGDLRLHDNEGNSSRDWALQNSDSKRRSKMLEFLDKTHICAMAYSGSAVTADHYSKVSKRTQKQTSLMEIMKMRTGSDSTFDSLKRVQSMGFGKVYLGGDFTGGIISVVPLISETLLSQSLNITFDTGFGTFVEQMEWQHMKVSVKQVKADIEPEDGIDNIITEAEYLGKLRHPNIVLLMGICQSISLENMWLIFEYFEEKTLHHFLHTTGNRLSIVRKRDIITQICNAMEFIHNQSLIHCGLSSMAVYLVSPHTAKLGNFEFMVESIKADLGKPSRVSGVSHGRFLFNWMAPELMRDEAPHFSSDVYSFCCIIWELYTCEVPWAGLEPQDIFQKVAEDSIPLNLDYAPLPAKFKAIVGFGLELQEEERLHKFSLVNGWLKSEEMPAFQRIQSPIRWNNKSCNHVELTSSSSHSSSLPSCTSVKGEGSSTYQDGSAQGSRRFCLDFESPVNTAFPNHPAVDLSHLSATKVGSNVSLSCSDVDGVPRKPPRSFTSGKISSSVSAASKNFENIRKSFMETTRFQQRSSTKTSPVSPSRIKPASHSYHYGSVIADCNSAEQVPNVTLKAAPNNSKSSTRIRPKTIDFGELNKDDSDDDQEISSVRAIADKFQQKQVQHKLRQAILRGSMAPRGSCQTLKSSSESLKTGSVNTDMEAESTIGGYNKHVVSDLSSVRGTPLIKSSSTPKVVAQSISMSNESLSEPRKENLEIKVEEGREENVEVFITSVDNSHSVTTISASSYDKTDMQNCLQTITEQEDNAITKRRAFIEDIKQKYSHFEQKSVAGVEMSESPYPTEAFRPNNHIMENQVDCLSSSRHCVEGMKVTKDPLRLPPDIQKDLAEDDETLIKTTSVEDDSFWTITPLVKKQSDLTSSGSDDAEKKVDECCILHADYPDRGYRVILKADGADLNTVLYKDADAHNESTPTAKDQEVGKIEETQDGIDMLQIAETVSLSKQQPFTGNNSILDGDRKDKEDLDGTFTVEDGKGINDQLNETFTLDEALPAPLFPQDTSFGAEKALEWVDNQFDKIKDNLVTVTDNGSSGFLPVIDGNRRKCDSKIVGERFYRRHQVESSEDSEVHSSDFDFLEYYIDDDFHQDLSPKDAKQGSVSDENGNEFVFNRVDKGNERQIFKSVSSASAPAKCGLKPPVMPRSLIRPMSENICQSAVSNISELDVRHKNLMRQSASDKDLSSRRSFLHTNTKVQSHSKSREGVPGKSIMKQHLGRNDGLWSGASDPSISTASCLQERKSNADTDEISQQAIIATEDLSLEAEDNTLNTISKDLSDEGQSAATVGQTSKREQSDCKNNDKISQSRPANNIKRKDEGNQADLGATVVTVRQLVYDSDSVDSDVWVKEKLAAIQDKIQRRKARMAYVVSSDEEEHDHEEYDGAAKIYKTCHSTSFLRHPKTYSDFCKPSRSLSCRDLGVKMDENYSKVMEELRLRSKARKDKTDKFSAAIPTETQHFEEIEPHKSSELKQKSKGSKYIDNLSVNPLNQSFREQDQDCFSSQNYQSQPSGTKIIHPDRERTTKRADNCAEKIDGKEKSPSTNTLCSVSSIGAARQTGGSSKGKTIFRSLRKGKSSVDSPEWESKKSISKESSQQCVLRKISKDSTTSHVVPLPMPRTKLKSSPSQMSKQSSKEISFETVTDLSDEEKYQGSLGFKPQPSENSKISAVRETTDSYHQRKTTANWLREQKSYRDRTHPDSKSCQMSSNTCSPNNVMRKRNKAHSISSKHSVVSFSKKEMSSRHHTSSKHSFSSGSKRSSQQHPHETVSIVSTASGFSCYRGDYKDDDKAVHKYAKEEDPRGQKPHQRINPKHSKELPAAGASEDQYLIVGLEKPDRFDAQGKQPSVGKQNTEVLGLHRFYIPKESWPEGCSAKLNVKVNKDGHQVTTTATNPASGQTETLLDEVFTTSSLKSTIKME